MLDQKLIEQEFGFLKDVAFLNASYVVMPPMRTQKAYHGFMDEYVRTFAEDCVGKAWGIVAEAREEIARLINCLPSEIAFVKNTTEGVGILANGYPFKAGENVIVPDIEHTSNLYAWIKLQDKGVHLKVIKSCDGAISTDDVINAMDTNTRAVAVSSAQFSSGFRINLDTLGQACAERNILLCVDGIQTLGRLGLDVQRQNIAYLACGGNKGLLATLGAGFVYCRQSILPQIIPPYASYQSVQNHVKPPAVTTDFSTLSWHKDARRLESGNPNYAGIAALRAGVSLLNEIGVAAIETHVLRLEERLRRQIEGIDLKVVTPGEKENFSGIICVYYPEDHEDKVVDILHKHKVYTTMRGGYIRLAIHLYNTEAHIDAAAEALREIDALRGTR